MGLAAHCSLGLHFCFVVGFSIFSCFFLKLKNSFRQCILIMFPLPQLLPDLRASLPSQLYILFTLSLKQDKDKYKHTTLKKQRKQNEAKALGNNVEFSVGPLLLGAAPALLWLVYWALIFPYCCLCVSKENWAESHLLCAVTTPPPTLKSTKHFGL